MGHRPKPRGPSEGRRKTSPEPQPASGRKPGSPRWKRRGFRLLAGAGLPLGCLLVLELSLRLAGFGYPTSFLLTSHHNGQEVFVQNNCFGWRFFGPQLARTPRAVMIPQAKPRDSVRVLVFGESAAYGDPQPDFGLPRMLQALLNLRYPGVRFEVVNAAMTGINSHATLAIARDCVRAKADVWVIYLGNNEVVGPFGAGTVFGPQTPALRFIRGGLALKATRAGQLLDAARRRLDQPPAGQSEWGGMRMFLEHQVRADDPRMQAVYHHFERNLTDILETGRRSGAGMVVSTVAVNLKDCAPFASAHRPGLDRTDEAKWRQAYQRGVEAQQAGRLPEATESFREAAALDDRVAELHFRWGRCSLAAGDRAEARRHFLLARDLDTLRFRCDSRLNAIIRHVASGRDAEKTLLADAEEAFEQQDPDALPGDDWFYEHVHLTFEGNYLLARTVAEQVAKLLPTGVKAGVPESQPWPSLADCAQRLSWSDWNRHAALLDMLGRLNDPPFTQQLNHDDQVRRLGRLLESLAPAAQPTALRAALARCREAAVAAPDDPVLHAQLAELCRLTDELESAAVAARRLVELLPSGAEGWHELGLILVAQNQDELAAAAFRQAAELDSQNVWAINNLAQALVRLGRRDAALREYQRAAAVKPRFGLAYLGIGRILETNGQTREAEEYYRRALQNRIHRAPELTLLARFCHARGWLNEAATNYTDAIRLNPVDPRLRLEAGQTLAALGRNAEAHLQYAEAARLAPTLAEARFLVGVALGRQGRPAEAATHFSEAVRLKPELLEARVNLGVALMNAGQRDEALAQFDEILRRSPTNAVALKHAAALRAKAEGR